MASITIQPESPPQLPLHPRKDKNQQVSVSDMQKHTVTVDTSSLLALRSAQILGTIASKSLQDLTDARFRWIPRDALFDAISPSVVYDLLRYGACLLGEQQRDLKEVVGRISPPLHECRCRRSYCTGGRVLFASLLSLSKPELVNVLFKPSSQVVCDAILTHEHRCAGTPNYLETRLAPILSPDETERFIHFTWQMRSPLLEDLRSPNLAEFPANVSLPWTCLEHVKDSHEEVTTIQKIVIHAAHHEMGKLAGYLALKILDDYHAERDHSREVKANLRTPHHDRIVPLLAAFKHREKFYLVLPWAHGGSLTDLFQNYSTPATPQGETSQIADWYSEDWLLSQCLGLADGLAAVHNPTNDSCALSQIHADIKPENILCFTSKDEECGPFTLKLADFGVAHRVDSDTGTVPVKCVPHTKTYRPPEHDTHDELNLNYDVWCLGCVFLEFITWAIAGWDVLSDFEMARLNESDDRQVSLAKGAVFADTFFKKTSERLIQRSFDQIEVGHENQLIAEERGVRRRWRRWWFQYSSSIRIKTCVKTQVKLHIILLKTKCKSEKLRQFLEFIESNMLVIDARMRASSKAVHTFLDNLN